MLPTAVELVPQFKEKVKGQTFVFTGATTGSIVAAVAAAIAAAEPALIVLVGRTQTKLDEVAKTLHPVSVLTFIADLSSIASSRATAEAIIADNRVPNIDYLVLGANNAPQTLEWSADGVEMSVAVSHVGHFVLTTGLEPKLKPKKGQGRVVSLTSAAYRMAEIAPWQPFDAPLTESNYSFWIQYSRAKLCNILFARSLVARGWSVVSVHPGPTVTPLFQAGLPSAQKAFETMASAPTRPTCTEEDATDLVKWPPKTPEQAAGIVIQGMFLPADSGAYFVLGKTHELSKMAQDDKLAEDLWAKTEKLVHEKGGTV